MTDYKIHTYSKADDKTLWSLANKELGNGSRWTEFLLETKPGSDVWIKAAEPYNDGVRVKIPVVSAPAGSTAAAASDLSNLTITASSGVNVRTGHGVKYEVLILGTNTKNKPFEYRKSSVIADGSYVWAEVTLNPPTKDKAGTVYNKGWICVKEGSTYYTTPNIDKL